MRERPILFSAPMVRAILAGTKTQTRRALRGFCPPNQPEYDSESGRLEWFNGDEVVAGMHCPYGKPGDRLRVKEAAWMWCERRPNGKTKTGRQKWLYVPMREAPIHYAADHAEKPRIGVVSLSTGNKWGWRLKIGRFLPAWASRITLEITGVRVERLQAISHTDAYAEGAPLVDEVTGREVLFAAAARNGSYRLGFRALWESINGPGSWDANPWVWCITFRRLDAC